MPIHAVNLRSVDLNLLTVFDAVVTEGSLTRAADKLGMSQPAISNALARFRDVVGDPLFVRTSQGMIPTARSRLLAEPVRQALDLIQSGLHRSKRDDGFDYRSSTSLMTVAAEDYFEVVVMPRFVGWLSQVAPDMRVRLRSHPINAALSKKLVDGSIDFAIRYAKPAESELRAKHLLDEEFVSLVRHDHPDIGDSLSLSQYLALTHVVFGRLGRHGLQNSIIDRELKRLGHSRRIALQVPGFQPMPVIVRNTNFICTLPRRMAQIYAAGFQLKILKTPLNLPRLPLYLMWSKSFDRDPAQAWFRTSLIEMAARL